MLPRNSQAEKVYKVRNCVVVHTHEYEFPRVCCNFDLLSCSPAAELLDPKAKEKSSSSSSTGSGVSIHFPWMTRDKEKAEKEAENKVQATLQGKISPPAKPSAIQSYAKSQQQFNTSCIKKEGHR